jgi:hypothetical protein
MTDRKMQEKNVHGKNAVDYRQRVVVYSGDGDMDMDMDMDLQCERDFFGEKEKQRLETGSEDGVVFFGDSEPPKNAEDNGQGALKRKGRESE